MRECTGKPVARNEERNKDTIPTPRLVKRPSTKNSSFPAKGSRPQNYVSDHIKTADLGASFRLILHTFDVFMLEVKIQNPSKCLFQFSSEALFWIKEVKMIDSVEDFKSSRSIQGCDDFPNFAMLDARIASALNKIIQNFPL